MRTSTTHEQAKRRKHSRTNAHTRPSARPRSILPRSTPPARLSSTRRLRRQGCNRASVRLHRRPCSRHSVAAARGARTRTRSVTAASVRHVGEEDAPASTRRGQRKDRWIRWRKRTGARFAAVPPHDASEHAPEQGADVDVEDAVRAGDEGEVDPLEDRTHDPVHLQARPKHTIVRQPTHSPSLKPFALFSAQRTLSVGQSFSFTPATARALSPSSIIDSVQKKKALIGGAHTSWTRKQPRNTFNQDILTHSSSPSRG